MCNTPAVDDCVLYHDRMPLRTATVYNPISTVCHRKCVPSAIDDIVRLKNYCICKRPERGICLSGTNIVSRRMRDTRTENERKKTRKENGKYQTD